MMDRYETGGTFFPYESRKYELSVQDGVLLWGSQIVVPPRIVSCVMVKMIDLARGYVWWPGWEYNIEKLVKSCKQ